ncbi:MAG: SpoIIE family protein phosphatase [Gallionella sp.]|jgi:CheY-like chemotaxis protein|nr:SpoIIE family protein phosphatase [Gallionella sp.]MCK9354995.1 SpoIIE family protein phosphatase [Gallionella sp.]
MSEPNLGDLTVLYVEDDEDMSEQVAHFLHKKCARVLQAANGREALEIYQAQRPDMIISDVMMPEMDGLEFSEIVKQRDLAMPIILTTAFNDSAYLHRAIDIGVDNYVLKPVALDKLHAAMLKSADLLFKTRALTTSRAQLEAYHQAAEEERALVSDLMKRMMQPDRMVDVQVQYRLEPADLVSGDLIAFRRSRNDKLYLMLADSTGHGLPAALNLLPVNHVFYSMVEKGLPVSQIVEEMNWAVKRQSPADRFVSAFVACIDPYNRVIETWNGGIPAAMLVNDVGEAYHTIVPNNLPLGILDRTFVARTDIFQWNCHSQLTIYSDGLVEAEDEHGVAWGADNMRRLLSQTPLVDRFDALIDGVHDHLGVRRAFDDMTLLMVDCAM